MLKPLNDPELYLRKSGGARLLAELDGEDGQAVEDVYHEVLANYAGRNPAGFGDRRVLHERGEPRSASVVVGLHQPCPQLQGALVRFTV